MINCPECNEAISSKAKTCPKCNHPQFENGIYESIFITIFLAFVLIGIDYEYSYMYYKYLPSLITENIYIVYGLIIGMIYNSVSSIRNT